MGGERKFLPSPQPSPLGRGRKASPRPGCTPYPSSGCPLSLRERVKVRVKMRGQL